MPQILRDITEINRCGAQYRRENLEPMGLKGCHASYLLEICRSPGISQDALARRIYINKSNVTRQLTALEEGGFVLRKPSREDKRILEIYPTEKTMELLPQIRRMLCEWSDYLTAGLTEEELTMASRVLFVMKSRAQSWFEEH